MSYPKVIEQMTKKAHHKFAAEIGITDEVLQRLQTQRLVVNLTKCCQSCVKGLTSDKTCYHGKHCFECPSYDTNLNMPPTEYNVMKPENWKNIND